MPKPKRFRTPEEEKRVQEAQADIKEREKLASRQGISSKEAAERLAPQVKAREEEKAKVRMGEQLQQPMADLAQRQLAELQNVDLLKTNIKPLTTAERNVAAGKAFVESAAANIGAEVQPGRLERIENLPGGKTAMGALGFIATTNIAGISLSSLFNPASANIQNLQSDVSKNVAESTRIARAAGSKGADINQAIQSITKLEESTRFKYNAAAISLRESPKDVREGLDLQDDMSRDLRVIIENKQALERFRLTGDINQVLSLGTGTG